LRADDKRVQEITALGLDYNLLTAYTSFVAIDSQVRNKDGRPETVKQPLPLPQGVSDYAVGQAQYAYAPSSAYPVGSPVGSYAAPAPLKAKASKHGSSRADTAYEMAGGYSGGYSTEGESKERVKEEAAIRIDIIKIKGALTKQDVLNSLKKQVELLRSCGQFSGKIILALKISADGSVKELKIVSGAGNAGSEVRCIRKTVETWSFAPAKGETQVEVRLTV